MIESVSWNLLCFQPGAHLKVSMFLFNHRNGSGGDDNFSEMPFKQLLLMTLESIEATELQALISPFLNSLFSHAERLCFD